MGNRQDTTRRPFEILLVEDNQGDARLIAEALRQSTFDTHLTVVGDGWEAMALLRGEEPQGDAARPDLIVLDMNLPRMNGREILAEMKGDVSHRSIPVVVLSSSRAHKDVLGAYDAHANCYVMKPPDWVGFTSTIEAIMRFWLTTAILPSED